MNTIPADLTDETIDIRHLVRTYCQMLVDAGQAQWCTNDQGRIELHLMGGETYLFGEYGVTRLK